MYAEDRSPLLFELLLRVVDVLLGLVQDRDAYAAVRIHYQHKKHKSKTALGNKIQRCLDAVAKKKKGKTSSKNVGSTQLGIVKNGRETGCKKKGKRETERRADTRGQHIDSGLQSTPLGGVQREFRGSFAPPSPRVRGCDLNPLGAPEGGAC